MRNLIVALILLVASTALAQKVNKTALDYGPVAGTNSTNSILFAPGEGGWKWLRIPSIVKLPSGTLLAVAEGRDSALDYVAQSLVGKRSTDNGVTWGPIFAVYTESDALKFVSNPVPFIDTTGVLKIVFHKGTRSSSQSNEYALISSTTDGASFSASTDLTSQCFGAASATFTGNVSNTANNGSGLIRITTSAAHGAATGWKMTIASVVGTSEANGTWTVTVINSTTFDLQGSTFVVPYVSGGTWTAKSQLELMGPGHAAVGHTGRIGLMASHRYTADQSGTAYPHFLYTADDGTTWTRVNLGDTSTYAGMIEGRVVKTSTVNRFYANFRHSTANSRYSSFSTNGGTTWNTPVINDGTSGTTNLVTPSCQGSLCEINSSTIMLLHPEDLNNRARMTARFSTDQGVTWPQRRVIDYGSAAYSDCVVAADGSIVAVVESGHVGAMSGGPSDVYARNINVIRIKPVAVTNTLATNDYFYWGFNDRASGAACIVNYATIKDYGAHQAHAIPKGAPVYASGRVTGDLAVSFPTTTDYAIIEEAARSHMEPDFDTTYSGSSVTSTGTDTGNFTCEVQFKTTDADGFIVGGHPSTTGWYISLVSGVPKFNVKDGSTTAVSISSTLGTVNDGNWHKITAIRDKSGTNKLYLYVDGVSANTAVTDTSGKISSNGTDKRIGQDGSGTNNLFPLTVDYVRFVKRVLSVSAPDETLPALYAGPQPTASPTWSAGPDSISGLKLWVAQPTDPTVNFTDDGYTDPVPASSIRYGGHVVMSSIDKSATKWLLQGSMSTSPYASAKNPLTGANDFYVNKFFDFTLQQTGSLATYRALKVLNSYGAHANGLLGFDFIQNTGVFTLSAFVKLADHGGDHTIFDTNNATSGNTGFNFRYIRNNSTTGKFGCQVTGPVSTNRVNDTFPASDTAIPGTWYHIAVVANGPGALKWWMTAVTPGGAVGAGTTGATLGGSNGTYTTVLSAPSGGAEQSLQVGLQINTTVRFLNGRGKHFCIYNTALSAASIQTLYDFYPY